MTQGLVGQPPWIMWGVSEVVRVRMSTGAPPARIIQGPQLARVNYKRPTAWAFLFTAEILSSNPVSFGADTFRCTVNFDVSTGLGRNVFQTAGSPSVVGGGLSVTESFAQIRWDRAPGTNIPRASKKWTTLGRTPSLDEVAASPRETVSNLVAQDIQAAALIEASVLTASASMFVDVQVGMYFAPLVHVRPDWFTSGPDSQAFQGAERNGR